ncbi:tryptophan-rich sensory protein TspO [Poseidonocella sedimentorum]|uniref:TspO and MBR related proteins n=1 Tax=Poseidonocella sedimentorum TaxID=871652 RepID=A0A1I6CYH4_9RHOB|nr:TspO/MBR family protein [Poseidonocella sedimentorum]SFQ98141.1 TspO and MBR related proteins [Poseidonocella sedimentorum]
MNWVVFTACLAACAAPAVSGMLFKPGDWYARLNKPRWTPPDRMFPVVWLILYVSMSIAAARVADAPSGATLLALWATQIAFNTLWSGVFFGLKKIRAALAILAVLWISVLITTLAFWQVDPVASALFGLYLIWITVAFALNAAIWSRTPHTA